MKTSQLIDVDAAGTRLYHDYDDETGEGTFRTVEDAQTLVDMNQAARNNESGNWKGDMHHVASIPLTVWQNWWQEFGGNPMAPENKPRLMKKLNDRDWLKLRVKSGRV
jgi:hypothetical protein